MFDCVGSFPFGRVVAGWACVSVVYGSLWCPLFVIAVVVVAGAQFFIASLALAVAQGFRCVLLRRQWSGLVYVQKP